MTSINYNAQEIIPKTDTIAISKKVGKKREPVGEILVHIPTLADIGVTYEKGDQVGEWYDKALRAAALTDARNKLKPGTVDLKPGAKIDDTLEALCAPSVNTGEALKEISELKKAFAAYIDKQKLSAKAVSLLTGMFNSPKAAAMQPAKIQEKFAGRVEEFVEDHGEDKLTAVQTAYIENLLSGSEDDDELSLDDL